MADSPIFLAIDFGSQSIRAHIIDQHGTTLIATQLSNLEYLQPQKDQVEQTADWFYTQLCVCCQNLFKQAHQQNVNLTNLNAMAITCMRNTLICLDKNNKPMRNAIVWNDRRKATSLPSMPWYWQVLFALGNVFLPVKTTLKDMQSSAVINYIYQHQVNIWQGIQHVLLLSGYLNFKVTGQIKDSSANIISYLPFNYKKQRWHHRCSWQFKALAIKAKWLPPLISVGGLLGRASKQSQRQLGLSKPLPIYAVAADKACEVFGSGCYQGNQIHISLGTAVTITLLSQKYIRPKAFYPAYPSIQPGKYLTEFMLPFGFKIIAKFIKLKHAEFEFLSLNKTHKSSLEGLIELYIKAQGIDDGGMKFDMRKMADEDDIESGFIGLKNHCVFQQYLSIMANIVHEISFAVSKAKKKASMPITQIYVGGGGANSARLLQSISNSTKLKVLKPTVSEVGVLGVAMNLAVSTQLYANHSDAMQAMGPKHTVFTPK